LIEFSRTSKDQLISATVFFLGVQGPASVAVGDITDTTTEARMVYTPKERLQGGFGQAAPFIGRQPSLFFLIHIRTISIGIGWNVCISMRKIFLYFAVSIFL